MKPTNVKLLKGLSAAMLCMGSGLVIAESVTIPATVTVNNAINFTSTGSLDFGTVRGTADTTVNECSGVTLAAGTGVASVAAGGTGAAFTAACTAAGTSIIQGVGGTPARPILTIAGVAPFTTLQIAVPNTAVDLTAAAVPPGSAKFQVMDFQVFKTSGTTTGLLTLTAGAGSFVTDAGGGATLNVGATLATDPGTPTSATYQDLAYSGTFQVTVTY